MTITHPNQNIATAAALFNRVLTMFNRIDKIPRDFGTGEPLTRGEIHFIVHLADNPLGTVTELAAGLGVTKGAVSQMHGPLERKGYLRRLKNLDNDKEVLLALTAKGEQAKAGHDAFHQGIIAERFSDLTEDDLRGFMNVLTRIELFADEYLNGK